MKSSLVILTPGFPSNEEDTNCLPYFQTFVRAVNRNFPGVTVTVISTQYPYRKDEYDWFGNRVISLNTKGISRWQKPLTWWKVIQLVKNTRKQGNVTGVLCFWCLEEALIGKLNSMLNATPLLIWICGQDAKAGNPWVKWIRPAPEEVVANSHFISEVFSHNYSIKPSCIVSNSIEPGNFPPMPDQRPIDLISVGSLIALKQTEVVLHVVKTLKDRGRQTRTVICGSGPEEFRLRRLAEALGVDPFVDFRGEASHEETISLMQQAKILVHPSSFEGYSTVCLEALYAGCEVVSFVAAEAEPVERWHIVDTQAAMAATCQQLLNNSSPHQRVLLHSADDSARQMMALLGIT